VLYFAEFGIAEAMKCANGMFELEEQEDGAWFYSAIDGSLLVPEHETSYTNEGYCVDFYYDKEYQQPDESQV